jgi:hypothetical protein
MTTAHQPRDRDIDEHQEGGEDDDLLDHPGQERNRPAVDQHDEQQRGGERHKYRCSASNHASILRAPERPGRQGWGVGGPTASARPPRRLHGSWVPASKVRPVRGRAPSARQRVVSADVRELAGQDYRELERVGNVRDLQPEAVRAWAWPYPRPRGRKSSTGPARRFGSSARFANGRCVRAARAPARLCSAQSTRRLRRSSDPPSATGTT